MAARLKDKKIKVYRAEGTYNLGTVSYVYRPVHPGELWAYMRDASAVEFYNSHAIGTNEEAQFTINWRPDVTARMAVVYRGQWFEINRVDAFEGYKEDLRLFVKSMGVPSAVEEYSLKARNLRAGQERVHHSLKDR